MQVIINRQNEVMPPHAIPLQAYYNVYHHLLIALGYDKEKPPVSYLLSHYLKINDHCLVASPMRWQATHNDVLMVSAGSLLNWSEAQSQAVFTKCAEFVKDSGMALYYVDRDTWLIDYGHYPNIDPKSLGCMLNQSIMPGLQALDEQLIWQRLMTEIQMLFATSPEHSSIVNGVWFWGAGKLEKVRSRPIICDDPTLFNLAQNVSHQVEYYSSDHPIIRNSIIFIRGDDQQLLHRLNDLSQKYTMTWYWNNTVYQTKPKPWYTRLWRKS